MLISTRSNEKVSASKAIINGLASDGGLYIFESVPKVDYTKLLNMTYKELSIYLLSLLLDDYTNDEIKDIIDKSYDNKFDNENLVGFKKIEDALVLELFHGPTLAFKDMALTVLPNLLSVAKVKNNIDSDTIILTATSGDTGGASLSGFSKVKGMKIIVFYPNGGVSKLQEMQMLSFSSDTAKVIAYDGNFDDTQNFVKRKFKEYSGLSSSNSINIGRLVPQIVYYFYSYLEMVRMNMIKMGEKINASVPTGNFGNILACYIAKMMSLPINDLICASNKNDVLTEFFNSGIYNKKREFYKTNSPSMDILISSNLERLLYLVNGNTKELMKELNDKGSYKISDEVRSKLSDFKGYSLNEKETLDIINTIYNKKEYLMDPHTAVSFGAYLKYKENNKNDYKTLVVSTASPYKFSETIVEALNLNKNNDSIQEVYNKTKVSIPKVINTYSMKNKTEWKKEEVDQKFNEILKEFNYGK